MRMILLIQLFLFTSFAFVQGQNGEFYTDYISGEMDHWKSKMDKMELAYNADGSYELLFDLTIAQYGYIAWCMSTGEKQKAKEYVQKAEKNADKMLQYDIDWARAHALKGAIYGFKAGQAPYKAPILGIRAINEIAIAFDLDPEDPNIWMEKGNIDLYKPTIFGGNKRDAIKFYLKAIELYEMDSLQTENSWLYLNTLSGLASAYIKTRQIKKANRTYQKILQIEPDFEWIRDDVYTDFRKKYMYINTY